MKNTIITLLSKFVPGLNFLLLGKYQSFYTLWAFLYLSVFLLWFILSLMGGSNVVCWIYVATLFLVNLVCSIYRPKNGAKASFSDQWKKKGVAVLIIIISVWAFQKIGFGIQYRITSAAMEPTLDIGDNVIANPFSLSWFKNGINREDLVVHRKPNDAKTLFIHRVFGIPGDEVVVKKGDLFLNGVQQVKPYFKINNNWKYSRPKDLKELLPLCDQGRIPDEHCVGMRIEEKMLADSVTWLIPSEKYFVIGDNIYNSFDSKYYGYIDRKDITAKIACHGLTGGDWSPSALLKMGKSIK